LRHPSRASRRPGRQEREPPWSARESAIWWPAAPSWAGCEPSHPPPMTKACPRSSTPGRRKDVPVADGERPEWCHPAADTVAIGRRASARILARRSSDEVRR
jgi:hypothetical protein